MRRLIPPDLDPSPGYSHVVEVQAGGIFFIAGQTALDSEGTLVGKVDFAAQGRSGFPQPRRSAGSSWLYRRQLGEIDGVPARYGYPPRLPRGRNRFFATVSPPAAPAITLIEVSKLYSPEFLIEIEAMAAA